MVEQKDRGNLKIRNEELPPQSRNAYPRIFICKKINSYLVSGTVI